MDDTEVGRIGSWVGLDVGKQDHHATVISAVGERLFELPSETTRSRSSGCSTALSSPDRARREQ
jgi:hypothetical protein